MKSLTLTVIQHGARCISVAVVGDEDAGGSAVPTFGKDALRLALLYLEELSTATITGELEHVEMMNAGRTFNELKAERRIRCPECDVALGEKHRPGCALHVRDVQ